MIPTTTAFSAHYAQARSKFLAACALAELTPQTYAHPLRGPSGETLATDVVRVGPARARRVLVLTSGVHGVELFAGSGCQIDWLLSQESAGLPPDTAVVVVHAINPWGSAWMRRYTEDNVDLCRNYVDYAHRAQLPAAPDYAQLHHAIALANAEPATLAAAQAQLQNFEKANGHQALYSGLMGGQYEYPEGMGYGGTRPTWSRGTMEAILHEHAALAQHVCTVDYHTGLGPYSYGSMVALQMPGPGLERMRRAFGQWVEAVFENGAPENFAPVYGHSTPGYERALPHAEVTAGVLEFGTGKPADMLKLLVDDQRDWAAGRGHSELTATRQALLRFFYPADVHWQRALADQSRQIIHSGLRFLAHSG